MQIKQKSPWEGGFENLSSGARQVVKTVVKDVKEQITGEAEKIVPEDEKKKIKAQEARNLAELNAKIEQVRKLRFQKEEQTKKAEEQKKLVEKKKEPEPVWKKMMNMGSQAERKVNAGG